MSHKDKYLKYKSKYTQLKKANNEAVIDTQKKCSIDDSDTVLFGDGGSTSLIVITKDKRAYKIFTLYAFDKSLNTNQQKKQNDSVKTEISIYQLLTKNIINKNISNHIVKYIGTNDCPDAKLLFKRCPRSYVEFMKLPQFQKSRMCEMYFQNYPEQKLNSKYHVVEIEYCDYSCGDYIRDISELPTIEMEKYLDILFFQIIYTIVSIQNIYPYFIHGDLFMRNILGFREKDNGNYYKYMFNNKTYFVPKKKFYPKINDFGFSNLDDKHKSIKLYKSEYQDVYNIIFDIYNGGNHGALSLTTLCKDNPNKIQFLRNYFSNFFNVDIIDEYKMKSPAQMDWNWTNILDDEFMRSIEMKNPRDLLNTYFFDIYNKIYTQV